MEIVTGVRQPLSLKEWVLTVPAPDRLNGASSILQPSTSDTTHQNGSLLIRFEGVLHNREALAAELFHDGQPSIENTGIILKAYEKWGSDFVNRLRGFFVFVLVDAASKLILCGRDPYGIYPLLYSQNGNELVFSNSIDALLKHPSVSRELNRNLLAEYLLRRWIKPEETFFSHINRVLQGHILKIDLNGKRMERYWDPYPDETKVDWADEEELERFDDLLETSVANCLMLGRSSIFLSGGLDSVCIAAIATDVARKRGFPDPIALSLIFPDPIYNEEDTQRAVARELGIDQVFINLEEAVRPRGLIRAALEISAGWPFPLLTPWNPGYAKLRAQAAQMGCEIVLTGGGGDEWLSVDTHYTADLVYRLQFLRLYRLYKSYFQSYGRNPRLKTYLRIFFLWGIAPILKEATRPLVPPSIIRYRKRRNAIRSVPDFVAPDPELCQNLVDRMLEYRPAIPKLGHFYMHSVRSLSRHTLHSFEMEEAFENSRRFHLLQLQPYWDAPLTQLLYRTPPEILNQGNRSKALIRKAVSRRFRGMGFDKQRKAHAGSFFGKQVLEQAPAIWQDMKSHMNLAELGIIDPEKTSAFVDDTLRRNDQLSKSSYVLWSLLNLETWVQGHR